jgi:hydrogenase maturation protein HypF
LSGDALRTARQALAGGAIVAVRGIGGFLLAADALNRAALTRLRERKSRPHKPLAVMAPRLQALERYCEVPPEAAELLHSPQAPIVILDVRPDAVSSGWLPLDLLSPDTLTMGVMLPTSPLHWMLAVPLPGDPSAEFELLVMTSGNRRGEPICLTNDEARERLHGIADLFLVHDREINLRNDDSVCTLRSGRPQVWRRARGYAPSPIRLAHGLKRNVLAMGAELKNAIAVGFDDRAVLSPHIGDLDTPEAVEGLRKVARSLPAFLDRQPDVVAVDLHPDMQSTRLGRELAGDCGIPVVEVQHHHAHALACLAENGRSHGLALVFDGTGLGPDGAIWGSELLDVEPGRFRRLGAFAAVPLPGGDAAVRRPARQLVARLWQAGVTADAALLRRWAVTEEESAAWTQQCRSGLNCAATHGAGRLFDSFAALLGLAPPAATYDGQAAVRLEAAARRHGAAAAPAVPFQAREADGMFWIDWAPAFAALTDQGRPLPAPEAVAMGAHRAIAEAALKMIEYGLAVAKRDAVALSGGVFMNRILTELVTSRLASRGIGVLLHRQTPPNDGSIALGQVVAAGG